MAIPQSTLDDILAKVDILDYISQDISLSRKGGRFWGCCPFHQENTPSFSVVPEKGFFYCFGCHKGGNLFGYIMEKESVDFLEAARIAAIKAGVQLQNDHKGPTKEERLKKEALQELYQRVAGTLQWMLYNHPKASIARDHLHDRAIDADTIDFFQLGYAPPEANWMYNFLKKKNYSEDFLDESGLFSRNRRTYPLFRNRLMFPIFDASGRVVAFSGRILEGEGPKYINSPETPIYIKGKTLFGLGKTLPSIKQKKEFVICEGNIDVLAFYQAGISNVVAPLGTAFTSDQLRLLKRYSSKGLLAFDNDGAGIKASMKAALMAEELEIPLFSLEIPRGFDPADLLKAQGQESLKKIYKNPVKLFHFLLKCSVEGKRLIDVEEKLAILDDFTPWVKAVKSDILRNEYLEHIADNLLLDKKVLWDEMQGRVTPIQRKKPPEISQHQIKLSEQLFLVLLVLFNPELWPKLKEEKSTVKWKDPFALELVELICRKGVPSKDVLGNFHDREDWKSWIESQENDPVYTLNAQEQFRDCLRKQQIDTLQDQREQISLLLKGQGALEDSRVMSELILEKKRLDSELEKLR